MGKIARSLGLSEVHFVYVCVCVRARVCVRANYIYTHTILAELKISFLHMQNSFFISVPGDLLGHSGFLLINSLPCWHGQCNEDVKGGTWAGHISGTLI